MNDRYELLNRELAAAFGPVEWRDDRAQIDFDGAPLVLELVRTAHGTPRPLRLTRPTRVAGTVGLMTVRRPGFHHIGTMPEVRTGDIRFDDEIFVAGQPAEVVRAALDDEWRSRLAGWADGVPRPVELNGDGVNQVVSLPSSSEIRLGRRPVTAVDLRERATALGAFARRLESEYDHHYSAIIARGGREAADAWHHANATALMGARIARRRRSRLNWLVIGLLAAAIFVAIPVALFLLAA